LGPHLRRAARELRDIVQILLGMCDAHTRQLDSSTVAISEQDLKRLCQIVASDARAPLEDGLMNKLTTWTPFRELDELPFA
jgi:hypothetical protein